MAFNWTCPYCQTKTTVNRDNFSKGEDSMTIDNVEGNRLLRNEWIVCPNEECKKITLDVILYEYEWNGQWNKGEVVDHWRLLPGSYAKAFPDYIPKALRTD